MESSCFHFPQSHTSITNAGWIPAFGLIPQWFVQIRWLCIALAWVQSLPVLKRFSTRPKFAHAFWYNLTRRWYILFIPRYSFVVKLIVCIFSCAVGQILSKYKSGWTDFPWKSAVSSHVISTNLILPNECPLQLLGHSSLTSSDVTQASFNTAKRL